MSQDITEKYQHKQVILEYETQTVSVRISTKNTTQKNLEKINKKISNKFKLHKQYKLSINEEFIESNDFDSLERILSSNKPPITIKIINNISSQDTGESFTLKIHHNNNIKSYPFALNLELWDDNMLYNLKLALKNEFKITSEFALCEDEDRELELDDIEDMKTAFDDIDDDKKNSSFVMTLYIRVSNNDQKEDYKEQQVNPMSFNVDKKESNNIIKFHKLIFSGIFSKKQSHVTDIQSKSFINGFHCLNLLRKIKHLEEKQKAQ
eukprot:399666_1